MCGILGIIGNYDSINFNIGLNNLSHRGPDGWGIWEDLKITLGHRRLSIIDLSDNAKQPMEVLDRYVITFNGEIYNYLELKHELELSGFKHRTNSDTEVLLNAYIKWGGDCVHKLNGMWAFAVWDKLEKILFMSRDRIGKKPLFYSQNSDWFAFSSEMKGLYPLFNNDIEVNYDLVQKATLDPFCYESTKNCLIKNINRFPAGCNGIFSSGELKITKYWHPLNQLIKVPRKYSEQVEMFRELFEDACKIRMRSDVTIGTALSGGLDSSSIICTMSGLSKKNNPDINKDWQHAFIACFPDTTIDETHYAKIVTDYINVKGDFINIYPEEDLDKMFYNTYLFEELYYAPLIPFLQLYSNVKERGVSVTIDGHGADELFGGYHFDTNLALIDALPNILKFNELIDTIWESVKSVEKDKKIYDKLKFALIHKYSLLKNFSKNSTHESKYENLDFFNSRLFDSTYNTVLPTLLRNYDRYSMINGVEIRMPFLDYRILQFAFSIPYSSKIRGGYTKAIIRDALKDILPQEISQRKSKIGFNSPMAFWLKRPEVQEWLFDQMSSTEFVNSNIINSKSTREKLEAVMKKDSLSYLEAENSFKLFMPYIWEKSLKFIGNTKSDITKPNR